MTEPLPGRRYNDKEVARIIKQASELQQSDAPGESASGLSLAELEQIAREAGIDPAMVRRAAVDLDAQVSVGRPSRFLGAPSSLALERTIDGEVSPDEYDALVAEIQRAVGGMGSASLLGRSLQWTSAGGGRHRVSTRTVQVTVAPKNGRTTIRIEEPVGQLAGGLFLSFMGGIGMGLMPLVGGGGGYLGMSVAGPGFAITVAIAACGAFLGGTYLLARTIFNRIVSRRGETLQALMSRLVEHVTAAGTPKG